MRLTHSWPNLMGAAPNLPGHAQLHTDHVYDQMARSGRLKGGARGARAKTWMCGTERRRVGLGEAGGAREGGGGGGGGLEKRVGWEGEAVRDCGGGRDCGGSAGLRRWAGLRR